MLLLLLLTWREGDRHRQKENAAEGTKRAANVTPKIRTRHFNRGGSQRGFVSPSANRTQHGEVTCREHAAGGS